MTIGVPYREALEMPLDMALAMLSPQGERQNNTHPVKKADPIRPVQAKPKSGTTYIATRFKNAEKNKHD